MNRKNILFILIVCCLTIGLAPFTPEPHLWGKLKWVAGGGDGMQLMDYGDLLLHGSPWIALVFALIYFGLKKTN